MTTPVATTTNDLLLSIENLTVHSQEKIILKNITLAVHKNELHVLMGPNGSGKSTLAHTLAGKDGLAISEGCIRYRGKDLMKLKPHERSLEGLFVAFQESVEIPGVSTSTFLKTALNEHRKHEGKEPLDSLEFQEFVREAQALTQFPDHLLDRSLNDGFSGGEKKKCELLQLALLKPNIAILDEIDSGVDVETIATIGHAIEHLHDGKRAFIVITHNPQLCRHIRPTHVHILIDGTIVANGDARLMERVEREGYAPFQHERKK